MNIINVAKATENRLYTKCGGHAYHLKGRDGFTKSDKKITPSSLSLLIYSCDTIDTKGREDRCLLILS